MRLIMLTQMLPGTAFNCDGRNWQKDLQTRMDVYHCHEYMHLFMYCQIKSYMNKSVGKSFRHCMHVTYLEIIIIHKSSFTGEFELLKHFLNFLGLI